MAELLGKKWTMRFDGSTTTTSNGLRIVLSCEDGDTMPLSFKLGFSYSNYATEYEAYLTRLTIALNMGVKHMRVLGELGRKGWSRSSRPLAWSTPKGVRIGSLMH